MAVLRIDCANMDKNWENIQGKDDWLGPER